MTSNGSDIKEYISSSQSLISFIENSKDHWHIKDKEARYIYMNKPLLEDLNIPRNFNIEGRLDKEIPVEPYQELYEEFVQHDKRVINENKKISGIEVHYYGKGNISNRVPRLAEKTPLYDDNNEIIGTVCYARIIDTPSLLYYMNQLNRKTIQFDAPNDLFTKKELEVIFWSQQRLSVKEIAKRLNITPQTAEVHIKNIYNKANVHSTIMLIEYCKHTGLDRYIPADFIRNGVQIMA